MQVPSLSEVSRAVDVLNCAIVSQLSPEYAPVHKLKSSSTKFAVSVLMQVKMNYLLNKK